MLGLATARASLRAGPRLTPQAVAFIHSASIVPLNLPAITALPKGGSVTSLGLRGYATQNTGNTGGSGSSSGGSGKHESKEELLDRLTREARQRGRAFDQTHDHVGPFPLGVGPSGRTKTWKSWSDLGLGGKREYLRRARREAEPPYPLQNGSGPCAPWLSIRRPERCSERCRSRLAWGSS